MKFVVRVRDVRIRYFEKVFEAPTAEAAKHLAEDGDDRGWLEVDDDGLTEYGIESVEPDENNEQCRHCDEFIGLDDSGTWVTATGQGRCVKNHLTSGHEVDGPVGDLDDEPQFDGQEDA